MMRILFSILLIGLLSPPTLAQATASKTDEISGNWIFSVQFPEETETYRTSLQVANNKFTGSLGIRKIEGSISDYDGALLFLGDGHAAQGDGELTEPRSRPRWSSSSRSMSFRENLSGRREPRMPSI
jgi:hypothetical protein